LKLPVITVLPSITANLWWFTSERLYSQNGHFWLF